MYNNQYCFYLERKRPDDFESSESCGPFLKYGKKGKNVSIVMDLSQRNLEGIDAANGIIALREVNNQTKFKIITPMATLYLRAESKEDRDEWIKAIL
jgi:hypothetical protein